MKLRTVADLCRHAGPFLTAYLDVSRDTAEANRLLDARWRATAAQLEAAGAPPKPVARTGERMLAPSGVAGPAGRMVVAAGNDILLDEVVPHPRHAGVAGWGALPDVTGWLADTEAARSVLLVLADRAGADLELYDAWPGQPVERRSIQGEALHLTEVPAGDWAHKEFQRRTEEVRRGNAREVAAAVDQQVRAGARVVAVTGDVRARAEIGRAVSDATRAQLVELDHGSRAAGSSREALERALQQAVRDSVVVEKLGVVREFQLHSGRGDGVARGVNGVLDALTKGQAERVLLAPGTASRGSIRPSAHPGLPLPRFALGREALRTDLAVLCAAAATDAALVVLGPRVLPDDGVAALLRWDQQPR
jgi:hypothetical protein